MPNSAIEIYNYREAVLDLATSGQPREEQLAAIAEAGYTVIINLALHDGPRYSLQDEAVSVTKLGLEYIHIPVLFGAPTEPDLAKFFDAMAGHTHKRINGFGCIALRTSGSQRFSGSIVACARVGPKRPRLRSCTKLAT